MSSSHNNSFHSDRAGAGGFSRLLPVRNFNLFQVFLLHPAHQVKLGVILYKKKGSEFSFLGKSDKEKFAITVAFILLMICNPLTFFGLLILALVGDTTVFLVMFISGTLINIYLAARLIK